LRNQYIPGCAAAAVLVLSSMFGSCTSPDQHAADADAQTYDILGLAAKAVTGTEKTYPIARPVDTLRQRLLRSQEPVILDLKGALDVAAENSRDYRAQKEALYRAALSLTSAQHNFAIRYGDAASSEVSENHGGNRPTTQTQSFTNSLSASVNTPSGARVVASFATNFLESLISGDTALSGPQSILRLTVTQPLLAGFGERIVREPLTQAERDVVYAMRNFERFRSGFSIRIVQDYYRILSTMEDLTSTKTNYEGLQNDRVRLVDLVKSGRNRAEDLDQARQSELSAENDVITTTARLEAALDNFKITLGLPTTTKLSLDPKEFDQLAKVSLANMVLLENSLVAYALVHRVDIQNTIDAVADAARLILVAEDTLGTLLDFTSAINVPNEASGKPFKIDWDKVSWSAGFDLNLALERLHERNAYRRALIAFDAAVRAREEAEDQLRADIRDTMRTLRSLEKSFVIGQASVVNAKRRVDRTEMFVLAGGRERTETRDVLEAKEALIRSQLSLTDVLVDFAVAKLQLLQDLDALPLEPKGLRYDPGLPLPAETQRPPASPTSEKAEETPR
jgi:outer membrane protein TolC